MYEYVSIPNEYMHAVRVIYCVSSYYITYTALIYALYDLIHSLLVKGERQHHYFVLKKEIVLQFTQLEWPLVNKKSVKLNRETSALVSRF